MRYAFAGDRQISCQILKFMIDRGFKPVALMVSAGESASHSDELKRIACLDGNFVFEGIGFKNEESIRKLEALDLDYIIGIHFPYLISKDILSLPKVGVLNLHPSYLPFNKGWNTPSWAILEDTKYGATLHFMGEKLDEGDIIHQKELIVQSYDTANSLYQKVLALEVDVFKEAFDDLLTLKPARTKQIEKGTSHKKIDLKKIRKFNLDDTFTARDLLDLFRALSTSDLNELPYYVDQGNKIAVKIEFLDID